MAYHDGHRVVHKDQGEAVGVCLDAGHGLGAIHRHHGLDISLGEEKFEHFAVGLRVCKNNQGGSGA